MTDVDVWPHVSIYLVPGKPVHYWPARLVATKPVRVKCYPSACDDAVASAWPMRDDVGSDAVEDDEILALRRRSETIHRQPIRIQTSRTSGGGKSSSLVVVVVVVVGLRSILAASARANVDTIATNAKSTTTNQGLSFG